MAGAVKNIATDIDRSVNAPPAPRVPTAEDAMRTAAARGDLSTVRSILGLHDNGMKGVPNFEDGTDYVPHTGFALLHEGEAVIPREAAEEARNKGEGVSTESPKADRVSTTLGGKKSSKKKSKKSSKSGSKRKSKSTRGKHPRSIKIRKAANGGFVAEHEGDTPEDNEVHQLQDMDQLHQHIDENLGDEQGGPTLPAGPTEQPPPRGGM